VAEFRFYAELGDFLPPAWRGRHFMQTVALHQSAKHAIEALGVPHTEVALLLINGQPASLTCRLGPEDRVAVLPTLRHFLPEKTVPSRFIADAHLGRLARHLRFAGVDTRWRNAWEDAELVAIACREGRIVLTRDRALLMHRALTAGCYVHEQQPLAQLAEVVWRFGLDLGMHQPSRCLECNAMPQPVAKNDIEALLPPRTCAGFAEFWRCPQCERVYWRGSHWQRMQSAIAAVHVRLTALNWPT